MGVLTNETDYFGLDIGDTSLRVVQLKKSSGKPVLVTYGSLAIGNLLATSDAPGAQEQLISAIKQLVGDARISSKNVVVGLPATNVFASVITTPKLSDAELAKAIKYQADQYIPMPLDQVKLDYSVLGPGHTPEEMEVLLVACPNTVADKYLHIIEKAGFEIVALEANAIASYRALVAEQSPAVVVLDTAYNNTDLSLIYQQTPRLLRSIAVGGNTFVKSVATALGLEEVQADQFIKKFGMSPKSLEGQVYKAVKPSVDLLVDEIGKSLKFFATRYPDVKVEKIVMTGGTSAMLEFPAYIANSTHLPVEIGNPWMNISYPANMHEQLLGTAAGFSVACGLALRNFI